MRLTKIIATIGPSSESALMIEKLILSGVNVFRFNLKHNSLDWHKEKIELVNKVAEKLNTNIGVLIDLQGPEVRLKLLEDKIDLKENELILLTDDLKKTKEKAITISHPELINKLKSFQKVVADDGFFEFLVEKNNKKVYLKVIKGGVLKDRKTINFPGFDFDFPSLVERDFEALKMAALSDIDYIALSFVRRKNDVLMLKKLMQEYKLKSKIVVKIETAQALENLEEIIDNSDGVMVARGDLGVEVSFESVPYWQKKIINLCLKKGKFVITATQMLKSMTDSPLPTRAELSDIANAVFDGTDAVMLSEETATGKYPLEAVSIMVKSIIKSEEFLKETNNNFLIYSPFDQTGFLAFGAYDLLKKLEKNQEKIGFLVLTESGRTAEILSFYRPLVPIIALSPKKETIEKLTASYGIFGYQYIFEKSGEVSFNTLKKIINFLKNKNILNFDKLIVLHGDYWGLVGGTSVLRLIDLRKI